MGITSSLLTLSTSFIEPRKGELRDMAEAKESSRSEDSRSSPLSWVPCTNCVVLVDNPETGIGEGDRGLAEVAAEKACMSSVANNKVRSTSRSLYYPRFE
jgi:hypothetical protein